MDVPISAHWLVFVKDWEEEEKECGLIMPLEDWNPAWKSDPLIHNELSHSEDHHMGVY